jgi:hypothetical protein
MPIFPPQTPCVQAWDRKPASATRRRQLIARDTVRPTQFGSYFTQRDDFSVMFFVMLLLMSLVLEKLQTS